ncbi:MAG: flavoprotein [Alphaproteobacteria bacterium GM202ARS2]|nr:flavoprotein [Alphaproteobacteria bacterium GM202ARS2]
MAQRNKQKKWAWALSGSGHFFQESLDVIRTLGDVDLFLSRAAEELLPMYRQSLRGLSVRLVKERSASSVSVARFYQGAYHTLIMAPMSSNTVAKCVVGISDTLITNVFAQAGKCRVASICFPCDTAPALQSMAPKGMVDVYPRAIDLANSNKMASFERVHVVWSMDELIEAVRSRTTALGEKKEG